MRNPTFLSAVPAEPRLSFGFAQTDEAIGCSRCVEWFLKLESVWIVKNQQLLWTFTASQQLESVAVLLQFPSTEILFYLQIKNQQQIRTETVDSWWNFWEEVLWSFRQKWETRELFSFLLWWKRWWEEHVILRIVICRENDCENCDWESCERVIMRE